MRPQATINSMRRKLRLLIISWIALAACCQSRMHAQAAAPALQFEVATVKPAAPSPDGHVHINYPDGGAFSASNITLAALMQWAWNLPKNRILDGPAWFDTTRFDLQAKADAEIRRAASQPARRCQPRTQSAAWCRPCSPTASP